MKITCKRFFAYLSALGVLCALYALFVSMLQSQVIPALISTYAYHLSAFLTIILFFCLSAFAKKHTELVVKILQLLSHILKALSICVGYPVITDFTPIIYLFVGFSSIPVMTFLYLVYLFALLIGRFESIGLFRLEDPYASIVKSNEFIIVFIIAIERIEKAFAKEKESMRKFSRMLDQ